MPSFQSKGRYGDTVDTVITLDPNQMINIAVSEPDIGFPWETRKIYEKQPGICGLKLLKGDTTIDLSCSKENWSYNNRKSVLELREDK